MPSLFQKVRQRLRDALIRRLEPPNRVDWAARVHSSAEVRSSALHGPVVLEEGVRVYRAEISGPVHVGRYSSLWGPGVHVLTRMDPVEIGNFCSIARYVSVHGYGHDPERLSTHFVGRNLLGRPMESEIVSKGPVRIGHDVWLGAGVHVLSGVSIGNGAVVGAGSVVTRDIPAYAVAVGVPARPIRRRFDDGVIEGIEELEWWEWSLEEIRERAELFAGPLEPEILDRYL